VTKPFFGRRMEFYEIMKNLLGEGKEQPRSVVITGKPGIGKSALLRQVQYHILKEKLFPTRVFLDAGSSNLRVFLDAGSRRFNSL